MPEYIDDPNMLARESENCIHGFIVVGNGNDDVVWHRRYYDVRGNTCTM